MLTIFPSQVLPLQPRLLVAKQVVSTQQLLPLTQRQKRPNIVTRGGLKGSQAVTILIATWPRPKIAKRGHCDLPSERVRQSKQVLSALIHTPSSGHHQLLELPTLKTREHPDPDQGVRYRSTPA